MPFIDVRITKKLTESQKDDIKSEIGAAMAIIGKPESYTMIGIQDGYTLYFGGKKIDDGAYVAVDVLGNANPAGSEKFTMAVCETLEKRSGLPGKNVYVEYRHTADWGWNGTNF